MARVPRLIVSLHDVHPGSFCAVKRQREDLASWGVSVVSHLVVPEYHHQGSSFELSEFREWVSSCQSAGDELVLHGYYHDRVGQKEALKDLFWTRLYTNQEAEFFALSTEEAKDRWEKGIQGFESCGWKTKGFIAPAWLLNPTLMDPLREKRFDYTVLYSGIQDLREAATVPFIPLRTLCWSTRAWWRRQSSLIWNGILYQILLGKGLDLRMSLHPGDVEYPLVWNQIMMMIRQLIRSGYQPVSYQKYQGHLMH